MTNTAPAIQAAPVECAVYPIGRGGCPLDIVAKTPTWEGFCPRIVFCRITYGQGRIGIDAPLFSLAYFVSNSVILALIAREAMVFLMASAMQ